MKESAVVIAGAKQGVQACTAQKALMLFRERFLKTEQERGLQTVSPAHGHSPDW